jgi:sulfate permease, SulP family
MSSKKNKFFDFSNLKGDILGGLTAGIVALPLALAFGVTSGLGPSAGLYGAIFISFFAALFGGTPTQISGPTAPMTAVSMVVVAGIVAANDGNLDLALPAILTVFLLAGIFQVVLGLVGIGKYIKYIPSPVVSGFMTAIGVIILITQILPAIGYDSVEDKDYVKKFKPLAEEILLDKILMDEVGEGILVLENFQETVNRAHEVDSTAINTEAKNLAKSNASGVIGTFRILPRAIQNINWLELLLTLGTIIVIYGFKMITRAIPSSLVAIVLVSGIAYGFDLGYKPIREIPSGIPGLNYEIFSQFSLSSVLPYVITALSLSLLGAIDSLLTSVVADNMTKTRHNSKKELIGQGIGNSIAAVFGGIPGAGATIRTVVNIKAGGKTKISGMVAGLLLLLILLALGPVASTIPAAVLAGILITVGVDVMDYKGLKAIPKTPFNEVFVMVLVLALATFWNLVFAVAIGLVISALVFMKKMGDIGETKTDVRSVKSYNKRASWKDELKLQKNVEQQVYIQHLYGPLFFGFASSFGELTSKLEGVKTLVIRFERVPYIDQSGIRALESAIEEYQEGGCEVLLSGLDGQPREMCHKYGLIPNVVSKTQVFDEFSICVRYLKRTLTNSQGELDM